MKVWLIGVGCGDVGTMTLQARQVLSESRLVIGAARLLESLRREYAGPACQAVKPEEILSLLQQHRPECASVVYSGDTGFYSGARRLIPLLEAHGIAYEVLPGISSLQYFAAKLNQPWQDWRLSSAHGVDCDPVWEVMQGKPVFFLTSGKLGAGAICRSLTEAGLGDLTVTIGTQLSYPEERIQTASAETVSGVETDPLSVMLCQPAPKCRRLPGIPDDAFLRAEVPMTKQEVRTAILSRLAPKPEDVCWDVGAGTGSVSVELSGWSRQVWAVERHAEARELIQKNREKFCAWNLRLVEGTAPEALEALPKPDCVFVGGSGGQLAEILETIVHRNPQARICVSAIAIETLATATEVMTRLGLAWEITQISVSRSRAVGSLHMMAAQNPVYLITGGSK